MSDNVKSNPERAGDATGQSPETEVTDSRKAKLADILKDLRFPTSKKEIQEYVRAQSEGNTRDLAEMMNGLREGVSYASLYEVEKDAGVVKDSGGK